MPETPNMTRNPLFRHKYLRVDKNVEIVNQGNKIVEACYDLDVALEILRIAKMGFADESVEFIIAANHLFLTKAGVRSRLDVAVTIDCDSGLTNAIKALFDTYISDKGERELNLFGPKRRRLMKFAHVICSSQDLKALVETRFECGGLAAVAVDEYVEKNTVMPKLKKALEATGTPTDDEVMRRLNRQSTNVSDFLSSVDTRSRRF